MGSIAAGEVPLGTDEAMNAEITAIWVEMQKRVAKLANAAGHPADPKLGVPSILHNLDAASNPRKRHPKASARVKKVFDNTLTVISNVGGIVADGASQVFGPAGQCYNAINFVIGAYKGYQSAFEELATLFDKCAGFLNRLGEYSAGKMGTKLTMVAYQHMDLFIQICDKAYDLRYTARSRFKTFMKSAFLSSNDMEGLTGDMEKLIDDEKNLVGALTFKYASLTHENTEVIIEKNEQMDGKLDILVEDSSANKDKREKDDDKSALLHILSYDKTSPSWDQNTQRPTDSWEISYNNIRRDHVAKTGEWLLSHTNFQKWVNPNSDSPVIGLVGSESSGKSYLTSTVIRHLRNNPITDQAEARRLVAFYWMDQDNMHMGDVAKSLVWQYAEDDDSYLQTVATKCRNIGSLDPKDILPSLLLDSNVLEKVDATFYIVINKIGGSANTVDPSLLGFIQRIYRSRNKKIRILFTATPGIVNHLNEKSLMCPMLSISEHNGDDVRKVITARMDAMDSLSNKHSPRVREIRDEIIVNLSDQTKGDYTKIDLALNTISSKDDVDEIRKVIANAGNPLIQNIQSEIETLAKTRSEKELQEINDIILWVEYGRRRLSVEEMSRFLEWKSNTVSVRSLLSKFRTKYSLFEVDSDGMVGYKSTKVHEAILQRDEIAVAAQQNDKKVSPSEVDVLKHFLDKMCPPSLLEKLDVQSYLDQRVHKEEVHIFKEDPATANAQLALYCLKVLTEKLLPQYRILRQYASGRLLMHLDLTDLAMINRDIKSEVGPALVKILTDDKCIDNAFFVSRSGARLGDWIFTRTSRRAVEKWIKDSAAMSKVDPESKAWVDKAFGNHENPFQDLLGHTARRMAYHCFHEPNWNEHTLAAFLFIAKYTFKVKNPQETFQSPNLQQIEDAEKWSLEALGNVKEETREIQMAWILDQLSRSREAEKRCRRALELNPDNYAASYLLGKIVESDQEAIAILTMVIEPLKADEKWVEENKQQLIEMEYELARRYWNVGLFDRAATLYTGVIESNPTDTEKALPILSRFRSHHRWADALKVVKAIGLVQSNSDDQKSIAMQLMDREEVHKILVEVMMETEQTDALNDLYKDIIDHATEVKANEVSCYSRYYGALALTKSQGQIHTHVVKMVEEAVKNDSADSQFGQDNFFLLAGSDLAAMYLYKAREGRERGDTERVTKYLRKLGTLRPDGIPEWQLMLSPQIYEARYCMLVNDEKRARQLTHDTFKVALELLSDDDLTNDADAFERLFFALLALGDTENATTALAMISLCQQTNAITDGKTQTSKNWGFSLGVREKTIWDKPGDVSWCKNCMNIIDEQNSERTFKGKLRFNICQGKHDRLYIGPWNPERLKNLPTGFVPWKDQDIPMKEWEKQIRAYMDSR